MKTISSPPSGIEDAELVRAAQRGSQPAFTELVLRYRPASLKMATSILRDREEAEDEVQNALCKAFVHLNQFQHQSQFSTWLTHILLNQCLMRLRKLRTHPVIYLGVDKLDDYRDTASAIPGFLETPEEKVNREQMICILQQEVRRIPPLLRSVLELSDVQQLPMIAVAEQLGIKVPTAKSRLKRARLELKTRFRQRIQC